MTDREVLTAIFTKAGIRPEEYPDVPGTFVIYKGYSGFFTEFTFNEDDSLKEIGAWE